MTARTNGRPGRSRRVVPAPPRLWCRHHGRASRWVMALPCDTSSLFRRPFRRALSGGLPIPRREPLPGRSWDASPSSRRRRRRAHSGSWGHELHFSTTPCTAPRLPRPSCSAGDRVGAQGRGRRAALGRPAAPGHSAVRRGAGARRGDGRTCRRCPRRDDEGRDCGSGRASDHALPHRPAHRLGRDGRHRPCRIPGAHAARPQEDGPRAVRPGPAPRARRRPGVGGPLSWSRSSPSSP